MRKKFTFSDPPGNEPCTQRNSVSSRGSGTSRGICAPIPNPTSARLFQAVSCLHSPKNRRACFAARPEIIGNTVQLRLRPDGGSFPPSAQFGKQEIHQVFLCFPNFRLRKNPSPPALAELCGIALGNTAQWRLRLSPNLLPQLCSVKKGKYIQYSRFSTLSLGTKSFGESTCSIMRCCLYSAEIR